MSAIVHLAKLSSLLGSARREACSLVNDVPGTNLARQAEKWFREITELELEVNGRSRARKY